MPHPDSDTGYPEFSVVYALFGKKLSTRIMGMLLAYLILSLAAIGLTLNSSWQLEGVAAAINDAGSLRMRSWKIAYQLVRQPAESGPAWRSALADEMSALEAVQSGLEHGDSMRPLFVPRDEGIPERIREIGQAWRLRMRPLADQVVATADPAARATAIAAFEQATTGFVADINGVVHKMEANYAHNTRLLRGLQLMLVALAVVGIVALMRFFLMTVIRPVHELQRGMRRMEREDLAARVPVLATDEFGDLSQGFNRMAEHLQRVYATLEERVESKTASLADKNRELNILYDITRFLSEPMSVDELSQRFIERVRTTFDAAAASVRLFDTGVENLLLVNHHGLSDEFVTDEAVLRCGECVCGQAILGDSTIVRSTDDAGDARIVAACARAGFATVSAIPVNHNKRTLGIFNLYFAERRTLSAGDQEVLQSLGQHLGMAIENARLRSREREMAVSEERNLIARELHDSVAQGLAFLNLQVQMLEQALAEGRQEDAAGAADMIHRGVQESYADMRELLQHFRIRFTQPDLDSAVRAALDKFTEQSGVPARLGTHGMGAPLDAEVETQVLYIVQEALSNVRKHAHAGKVEVELRRDPDGLTLTVSDDGQGFEPAARPDASAGEHIGLLIMSERALRIGGRLDIQSSPGRGTRVCLALMRPELEKEAT